MLLKLDLLGPPVVTWLQGHIEEIKMQNPPSFTEEFNEEYVPAVERFINNCGRLKKIFLVYRLETTFTSSIVKPEGADHYGREARHLLSSCGQRDDCYLAHLRDGYKRNAELLESRYGKDGVIRVLLSNCIDFLGGSYRHACVSDALKSEITAQ